MAYSLVSWNKSTDSWGETIKLGVPPVIDGGINSKVSYNSSIEITANISSIDGDLTYRIYLNEQLIKEESNFISSPAFVSHIINPEEMKIGVNTISIKSETKDSPTVVKSFSFINYKYEINDGGVIVSWSKTPDEWNSELISIPIQNKYLIQDSNQIKTYLNGNWTVLGLAPATRDMFDQGMEDVSVLTAEVLGELESSTPELLVWTDEEDPSRHVKMTGDMWVPVNDSLPTVEQFETEGMTDLLSVPESGWNALQGDFDVVTYTNAEHVSVHVNATPYGQLVFAETDFSQVEELQITASSEGVKLIASGDGGITWYTFSDSWQPITASVEEVSVSGMTPEVFNAITVDDWKALGENIRLAYFIEDDGLVESVTIQKKPVATETPSLDSIKIVYDEVTIEGRLKELERINAINMAKLQFKTNALIQADKYNMYDLVVDTFEDDSMVLVESGNTEIKEEIFSTPVAMENGFYSEVSLENVKLIKKVEVK